MEILRVTIHSNFTGLINYPEENDLKPLWRPVMKVSTESQTTLSGHRFGPEKLETFEAAVERFRRQLETYRKFIAENPGVEPESIEEINNKTFDNVSPLWEPAYLVRLKNGN